MFSCQKTLFLLQLFKNIPVYAYLMKMKQNVTVSCLCGLTTSPLPDPLNTDKTFSLNSFNNQDTLSKLVDPFFPSSNKL